MRPWARWAILAATGVAVVILFVILSPGGATEDGSPASTRSASTSASVSGSPDASPGPPSTVLELRVTVSDGSVRAPERPTVTQGTDVVIIVRADVSDEVHVHGYDLMADVAPAEPARIEFRADVPGVFDIELEDAGRLLFQLEITP